MSAGQDAGQARARRRTGRPARPWSEVLLSGFDPIAFGLFGLLPVEQPPVPRRGRPVRRPRRRAPAPDRYYVGRRSASSVPEVFVVGTSVEPLLRSLRLAAGFDWGRDTPGALELAHAILTHALAAPPAESACRRFAREVLAVLDPDGFVLARNLVLLWTVDAAVKVDRPGDDSDGPLARATARIRRWRRHS